MTHCALCDRPILHLDDQRDYPGIVHLERDQWAHATCYARGQRAQIDLTT